MDPLKYFFFIIKITFILYILNYPLDLYIYMDLILIIFIVN
jgi:hypothetical protein